MTNDAVQNAYDTWMSKTVYAKPRETFEAGYQAGLQAAQPRQGAVDGWKNRHDGIQQKLCIAVKAIEQIQNANAVFEDTANVDPWEHVAAIDNIATHALAELEKDVTPNAAPQVEERSDELIEKVAKAIQSKAREGYDSPSDYGDAEALANAALKALRHRPTGGA